MNKIPGQNFEVPKILTRNIQLKKRFTSMATVMKMKKNEEYEIDEIEQKLLAEDIKFKKSNDILINQKSKIKDNMNIGTINIINIKNNEKIKKNK